MCFRSVVNKSNVDSDSMFTMDYFGLVVFAVDCVVSRAVSQTFTCDLCFALI